MKQWKPEAVEALKRRSEQSRRGEPVEPSPASTSTRRSATSTRGDYEVTLLKGKPKTSSKPGVAVITLNDGAGPTLKVRTRRSRSKPSGG